MEELYSDTKLAKTSKFYLMEHLSKKDIFYWLEDLEKIVKNWEYIMPLDKKLFELIKEWVDKDLWFYDTKKRKITANSKSLEVAFKRLLKELKK